MIGKEETDRVARMMEFLPASSSCIVVGQKEKGCETSLGTLLQSRVNSTENSRTADRTSTQPVCIKSR